MAQDETEHVQPQAPVGAQPDGGEGGGESKVTVLLALGANIGVGVLKLAAGLLTGSGALLSEAAHSAGDSTTEVLLLVAQKRSEKPADRTHPFGYGKERYFWSLMAAVAIFVSGAAFSFYEGLTTIFGSSEESGTMLWINYVVLALAAVLEGTSFRQAALQMRRETRRLRLSVPAYLERPRDPTVNSVLLEDSAALIGLAIAALGVALHQITGDSLYDGIASMLIGCLLLGVSFVLTRACKNLLVGQQADPRLLAAIERWLEDQPEVDDVVDLLTMMTGADSILLCARVDFVDSVTASELEKACVRLDRDLRKEWKMLDEIFIQPASCADEYMRERVAERYGEPMADV
ncbi:MAG TPA: cation diffusion facilitator family transporter [Jatrophihabitans sp.]|nr:cation diffusion facilitator family transporter [Jatrophihabitans sp.]